MILSKLKTLGKSVLELIDLKDTVLLFKLKKKFRNPKLDPIMLVLTTVGSAGFIWLVPGYFLLKPKKTRLNGIILFTALGSNVFFNSIVTKLFFHRKRPSTKYPDEYILRSLPVGYSFPSGHALTSFTAATIYNLMDWKNVFWTLPLASSIAFSRVYLFVHYPSDVLVGIGSGMANGFFFYYMGHYLYDHKTFPFLNRFINNSKLFDYLPF